MVGQAGQPTIVDFSFSELSATRRQMDLDVAELLASLAALAGEDRAVSTAVKVLGAEGWRRRCRCCSRWPCRPGPGAPSSGRTAC